MNTNKRPVLNMEKLHKAVDDEAYYSGGWPHVTKALEVLESHGILTYESTPAVPAPALASGQLYTGQAMDGPLQGRYLTSVSTSFVVPGTTPGRIAVEYRWVQKEGNPGFWNLVKKP